MTTRQPSPRTKPPYTVAQACGMLGVSNVTFYKWINEGKVDGAFKSGWAWMIPQATVEAMSVSRPAAPIKQTARKRLGRTVAASPD